MQNIPKDYLLKLMLNDIGLLKDSAYRINAPILTNSGYTICLWFYTDQFSGIKIIANFGNKILQQSGWTVYIQDHALVFRFNYDGQVNQELFIELPDTDQWHHFAATIDSEQQQATAYLNGSQEHWQRRQAEELIEPESVTLDTDLIIGGYTDAAGGHFNYRFGTNGRDLVDDFRLYSRVLSNIEISAFSEREHEHLQVNLDVDSMNAHAPVEINFTATSSLPESKIIAYLWDFGDDNYALTANDNTDHHYAHAGRYTVKLMLISEHHTHATCIAEIVLSGAENPITPRPLFINGTEGYACYRIPAIVRATNGDLIAFAEGRVADCSDATPVIHIVCKRSSDNGASWQAVQVVARNIVNDEEHACMNPSPVVDVVHGTGKIIVVFNKMEYSEWVITQGQGISRVCCIYSDDHGQNWGNEKDITLQVHKPFNPNYVDVYPDAAPIANQPADWRKQVPTLGHALQLQSSLRKGRLFYIGCRTEGDESVFYTQNYPFWSDDLGITWYAGPCISVRSDGSSAKGLGEATAVELTDGSIMVNSRNYQAGKVVGQRAVTLAHFDADDDIHFAPTYHDATLIDSGVQASIIRYQQDNLDILLFANPNHPTARQHLTLRISHDSGKTWSASKLIDPGPAAYSDLVIQNNGYIGLLYERGNHGGIAYTQVAPTLLS